MLSSDVNPFDVYSNAGFDTVGGSGSGAVNLNEMPSIPLFLNWRTLIAFFAGCGMVPVVGFLDYSHDLDGPWLGENNEGKVFGKWWVGTDGTYFGVFLESPWPFVIMWFLFGFSSFLTYVSPVLHHKIHVA
jgi:hypothetical protein